MSHSGNSQDRKKVGVGGWRNGILLVSQRRRAAALSESQWETRLIIPLSCFISQQPVRCCVVATASTPRAVACVSTAGRGTGMRCAHDTVHATRSAGPWDLHHGLLRLQLRIQRRKLRREGKRQYLPKSILRYS